MDQGAELGGEAIELPNPNTRPSTGSSFHSGITSPSGSSEDEFFDAPESLGSQGTARSESPTEPRISTPIVSNDISPTIEPADRQPTDELPLKPFQFYPTAKDVLERLNGSRHSFPEPRNREEDLNSLESIESSSETETITPGNIPINPNHREEELEPNLVEETTIPGADGGTTNILTFHSPNPTSGQDQFIFKLIDKTQDPTPPSPTASSTPTEETLQNPPSLSPTSDPQPTHPHPLTNSEPRTQLQMQVSFPPNPIQPLIAHAQKLYSELGSLGTPPPPCPFPMENLLQEIPFSPLPPPPPLHPSFPLMPEMELNPLYSPESIVSEQLLHPGVANFVMHPLTHQMMLAQHQVLGAHLNSRMPHIALGQQLHPNNAFPANFIPGFQPGFSSPQHFPLPTQTNFFEPQINIRGREQCNGNDSENEEELADWRRDLKLKERRILREKFGDNHPDLVTEEFNNSYFPKPSHNGTTEIENRFPEPQHFYPTVPDQVLSIRQEEHGCEERDSEIEETGQVKICYPSLPLTSSDEESSILKSSETIQREDVSEIVPGFITRRQNLRVPAINLENSIVSPSDVGCTSPPFLSPLSSPFSADSFPNPNPEPAETHAHPFIERETVRYNITTFSHEEHQTPPPHSLSAPNLNTCSPPGDEFTWTRTHSILYPPLEVSPAQTQLPNRPIARPPPSDLTPQKEIKRPPNADRNSSSNSTPSPYKPTKREISYPPGLEPGTSPKKLIVYPPNMELTPERKICYPPPREIKRPPISQSPFYLHQNVKHSSSYFMEREILFPQPDLPSPKSTPSREIIYPPRNPAEEDPVPPSDKSGEMDQPADILSDENSIESIPRSLSPTEEISGEENELTNEDCPRESTPKKKTRTNEKHSDTESDIGGFQSASEVEVD